MRILSKDLANKSEFYPKKNFAEFFLVNKIGQKGFEINPKPKTVFRIPNKIWEKAI